MITKIHICGYRIYKNFTFCPNPKTNILVGDNDAGKSTLMEAVSLALNGRIGGRSVMEELNPHWFNAELVGQFVTARKAGEKPSFPEILIELYLRDDAELQVLCGAVNTDVPTNACPGVFLRIFPNEEYQDMLDEWLKEPSELLPVEYYTCEWRSFADRELVRRPRLLSVATIDSRTVKSTTGVDYHLRQILSDHLEVTEKAAISLDYRKIKASMTEGALAPVNARIAELDASLQAEPMALAMDQTSRTSWESAITPHVDRVPFAMAGLGQQAAIKISLAMKRHAAKVKIVMIEEPENHLSHTSLRVLLDRIEMLSSDEQQLFISTHSTYVLNRLGLDALHLLTRNQVSKITDLSPDTVRYFQRLPGYDTLRLVLARKVVLVEGPSDEIIFERVFFDLFQQKPMDAGIDVISMRGLALARCLELCHTIDKPAAVMRDNDGTEPDELREPVKGWLDGERRELFIGAVADGYTLEPQLINANGEKHLREVLGIADRANLNTWMAREKTEGALLIAESDKALTAPGYMRAAAEFILNA
ncbi:ATP-dependent nuclease [Halopseudomonas yangmingensis]|uniref:Predicted ATP-dependent endonuclease of the OLD family, contains P-loop ATPase and TOPRIM domains n=1 Tax=Halopseudomonas yangmingensis TaxID=1720063 RepID=A0A1I4QU30_9GAMM|nr:AAA family ATPase [Halopseudomonas yangmingensis]SFM43255.1 Predicted ATP-dependent endonuclease of the OLD family, contains P-loop ATPase and TOPRIM domains [Halopseudomonas yangmingensis]